MRERQLLVCLRHRGEQRARALQLDLERPRALTRTERVRGADAEDREPADVGGPRRRVEVVDELQRRGGRSPQPEGDHHRVVDLLRDDAVRPVERRPASRRAEPLPRLAPKLATMPGSPPSPSPRQSAAPSAPVDSAASRATSSGVRWSAPAASASPASSSARAPAPSPSPREASPSNARTAAPIWSAASRAISRALRSKGAGPTSSRLPTRRPRAITGRYESASGAGALDRRAERLREVAELVDLRRRQRVELDARALELRRERRRVAVHRARGHAPAVRVEGADDDELRARRHRRRADHRVQPVAQARAPGEHVRGGRERRERGGGLRAARRARAELLVDRHAGVQYRQNPEV